MMTKQCFPRQTIKYLSSSFARMAALKRLWPFFFFFRGCLNVSIYFDRHGDHIRFMKTPGVVLRWKQKRLGPDAQTPTLNSMFHSRMSAVCRQLTPPVLCVYFCR